MTKTMSGVTGAKDGFDAVATARRPQNGNLFADALATEALGQEVGEGFTTFWTAYPRKCNKIQAERAYRRLRPSTSVLECILADVAAKRRQDDWRREGGRYIPHPATYLNGRRWEDGDGRPPGPAAYSADDWYEECGRLHDHRCSGRYGHCLMMGS
jgi:hypothetical protein